MKIKNIIISFLLIQGAWLVLNGKTDAATFGIGAAVSLALSVLFCNKCDVFSDLKLSGKSIAYIFLYILIFLRELVKSNLNIAKVVLTPSLPINPGILEVNTKLKSKMGRLILANSITLTPGTLTVEVIDDKMYIHQVYISAVDSQKATEEIVSTFEKYLEVIYG